MPYEFSCPCCGATQTVERRVDDRDQPTSCAQCGSAMRRVLGKVQICASPEHLKEHNRLPTGFSERDIVEMRRQDDADYEAGWNGANPSLPAITDMHDVYHGVTQEDVHREMAAIAAGDDE